MEGNESRNDGASSARPLEAIKHAHLPRLARRQQQLQGLDDTSEESGGPSRLTLSERLTRMRIEDRRRERNRDRANQAQRQLLPMQGDHTAFSTPSASARAGTLYHQSSQLAEKDVTQRREANALRNKFAGPAPPTSWRSEQTSSSSSSNLQKGERVMENKVLTKRRRSTAALRLFVDGEVATNAATTSLMSLRDACLIRLAKSCRRGSKDTEGSLLAMESISLLPMHLKERFMALAGREQRCEGLNVISSTLLFDSYRNAGSSSGSTAKTSITEKQSDWDADEDEEEEEREGFIVVVTDEEKSHHTRIINVDLSYASIAHKRLRRILTQRIDKNLLRTLSLAGWGHQEHQKSLSSLYDLMEMIGNLVHLETLSLANSRLSFSNGNPTKGEDGTYINTQQQQRSKESRMLESMTFLKRLSRASLRLKVLDLSECDWIVGPDVANLGWYSIEKTAVRSKIIWPRLQHLILHNCPAFIEPDTESNVVVQRSPSFVAKWHAAHHGVTDSPYLLDHRPGLGRALFQASDPHAERRERQARLRRSLHADRGGETTTRRKTANGEDEYDDIWGPSPSPSSSSRGIAERSDRSDSDAHPPASFQSSSSSAYPTRCPVSGVHVRSWEWERARVLDAIRGRWGSAINGNDALHLTGVFIEVYF